MYDQFGRVGGNAGQGGAGGFGGFDFSNFSNNCSGEDLGDLFGNVFGGNRRGPERRQGENIELEVTVLFSDAVTGAQRDIEFRRYKKCETCAGNGAEPGSKVVQCATCGGTGQVTRSVNSFFG